MTRNRDDFSFFQALRAAVAGFLAIACIMLALGAAMAEGKAAALERASAVAETALQFEASAQQVTEVEAARG